MIEQVTANKLGGSDVYLMYIYCEFAYLLFSYAETMTPDAGKFAKGSLECASESRHLRISSIFGTFPS